ncbi:MAG: L7Ae/L30e/S12e/Gadd45 family ribosomal protein [bacterium]
MSGAKLMKIEEIRGLLGLARRAALLSIGSRETRTALRRGEIRLVLLAEDASPRDRARLERVAEEEGVPARTVESRASLGAAIGAGDVTVVGVRDRGMAEALEARLAGIEGGGRSR